MLCLSPSALAFKAKYRISKHPSSYDFNGEKLTYGISWWIFHVADAESYAKKTSRGYEFTAWLRSAGFIRYFRDIKDSGYSLWDGEKLSPLRTYLAQHEGHYRRQKTFIYDLKDMKVTVIKKKPNRAKPSVKVYKIPSLPFEDLMTGLFFYRKYGIFKKGALTVFPAFTGKEFMNSFAKVVKREKVSVPAGTFDTYKCALSSDITPRGIFKPRGDIYVWVTADERHIPVKVEAQIIFGTVRAELTKIGGKR